MNRDALAIGIEVLLLCVAAILTLRVLLKGPIRRELRAHPAIAAGAFVIALAGLGGVWWVSTQSPGVRRAIVAVIAIAALLAVFRARVRYGTARGLPPGSLGLATSLDAIGDPTFYARAAARHGPIFKMSQIHRPVVCITDLAVARDILAMPEVFTQSDWSFNRLVPRGYLEYMNGDVHAAYRAIFAHGFTRAIVDGGRTAMSDAARAQLQQMAADNSGRGIDPEPWLLPVSLTSLLHTVLGVSATHERFAELSALFTQLNRPVELFLPTPRRTQETYEAIKTIVVALIGATQRNAASHASVLGTIAQRRDASLGDATATGNLILMVKEGSIMVRGLLRWVLKRMAENGQSAARFRAVAHDATRLDAVATAFVLETIRLHENRYLYRVASREARVGPYTIPAGWLVRLCLGEAHEHPAHFPNPHRFDPARFDGGTYDRAHFCPFGAGQHACLGADVALEIAKAFACEVAIGYDTSTAADGSAWRINRHWGLWRPSQSLRIAFSSRSSEQPSLT